MIKSILLPTAYRDLACPATRNSSCISLLSGASACKLKSCLEDSNTFQAPVYCLYADSPATPNSGYAAHACLTEAQASCRIHHISMDYNICLWSMGDFCARLSCCTFEGERGLFMYFRSYLTSSELLLLILLLHACLAMQGTSDMLYYQHCQLTIDTSWAYLPPLLIVLIVLIVYFRLNLGKQSISLGADNENLGCQHSTLLHGLGCA